jgi:galactokinase
MSDTIRPSMPPSRTFWAPGRVNLIGEHTDYAGGLVLPAAIDLGISITGTVGRDIELTSTLFPGVVRARTDGSPRGQVPAWGRFIIAIVRLLARAGRHPVGFEGVVDSSLPAAAGLASSAALGVATATTLSAVAGCALEAMKLAELVRQAESDAVGVACGIMDPAASILGRQDHALFLDCSTLIHRLVPLPPDLELIILDSGIRRRLETSPYAIRQQELQQAIRTSGATLEELKSCNSLEFGDVTPSSLEERRLRHFIDENRRVCLAVELLESHGDWRQVAGLLTESHNSLRDNFDVSTPELDALVEAAIHAGAAGARMTGAGFGGSVIALTAQSNAREIADEALAQYLRRYPGLEPSAHLVRVANGAAEVTT